jgi:serine/threonine-protein kinase
VTGRPTDLEIGRVLDNFELEALVGRGGMGTVYRARDTKLGRTVAVKVLSPENSRDEELLARFKNEAQSAARLEHENVARVFHVGECDGIHYIVYEFIEGTNLRDLVDSHGPLPIADAVSYTLQIAETLAHAFERDVVHRDIKPSNILVTAAGQAKLVDMGLARLHQVEHSKGDLTASGVTLGTFDYISPEQARDPRSADVRSDLYSLGCTLYFTLTGRPPFPDGTVLNKLLQHAQDTPQDPREFRDEVPDELARIVAKMLAKSPEHRYALPRELIGDLLLFSEQHGLQTGHGAKVWPAHPPNRSAAWEQHVPWAIPVLLLIAAVWFSSYFGTPSNVPGIEPPSIAGIAAVGSTEPRNSPPGRKQDAPPSRDNESPFDFEDDDGWPEEIDEPPQSTQRDKRRSKDLSPAAASKDDRPSPSGTKADSLIATVPAPAPRHPARTRRTDGSGADAVAVESAVASVGSDPSGISVAAADRAKIVADVSADAGKPEDSVEAPPGTIVQIVRQAAGQDEAPAISLERALATALADAKRQELTQVRIELRYNGVQELRPVVLDGINVQIVSLPGFSPTILFHAASNDPDECPRSMITVMAGQLTLDGVHLVMRLPRDPAERWSLFDLHDAEILRLTGCTMTIENAAASGSPLHQGVSFIEVRGRRDLTGMMMPDGDKSPPLLAIRLDDCVARGEATLLKTQSVQAVRLTWNNGLLATSERLLSVEGTASPPPVGKQLKLTLSHVTAAVGRGLALAANAQHTPYQLLTEIESASCIILGRGGSPLVEQRGVDSIEDFRERLLVLGEKNFYEGFNVFWRVHGVGFESEPADMDFNEWRNHWAEAEKLPHPPGQVQWRQLPAASQPFSAHRLEDYALRASENNPARESAAKGQDAGARFDALPKLPSVGDDGFDAEETSR